MGFFDKIQDTINTAAEQVTTSSQNVQLKKERKQQLEAIGEQAYNLYLNGQLAQQELAGGCEAVVLTDQRLQEVTSQMQAGRPPQQAEAPPQPGMAAPPQAAAEPGVAPSTPPPPAAQASPPPPPGQAQGGTVPPPPPPPEKEA